MKNRGKHNFLQSDFWWKILAAEGEKVFNFSKSGFARGLIKELPLGFSYAYLPRGPIFQGENSERELSSKQFIKQAKTLSAGQKMVFLRVEPSQEDFLILQKTVSEYKINFKKSLDLQPKKTLLLDLNKNIDQLEKELSQKTRYNIRLADKKGVKVFSAGSERFVDFWHLMKITGERDRFGLHGKKHYLNLLENGGGNIELWLAEFEGQIIAAGIFCFYEGQVIYLHGASDNQYRNLMAPHLLQWRVILEAKKRACCSYDFYGIDENKWPGVTRFKKGFGGYVVEYPGTYDLVLKPEYYYSYHFLRSINRALRKFL